MSDEEKIEIGLGQTKLAVAGKGISRVADSVADLLSPFSQGFGLVGDHIRIYRERSLESVLLRANALAEERGEKPTNLHPKNLVQLAENASLEDDDADGLAEVWARLLLSGTETFDAEMAQLSDSLKRIGKTEAEFLRAACTQSSTFPLEMSTDSLPRHNEELVGHFAEGLRFDVGEEALSKSVNGFNNKIGLHYGKIFQAWIGGPENRSISHFELGLESAKLLAREQLMRVVHVQRISGEEHVIVSFCDVTDWGVKLICRCYPELVHATERTPGKAEK